MSLTILDATTLAAVKAATTQVDQRAALIAAWAGAAVTVKSYATATLRDTGVYGTWVLDSATPRGMTLGAMTSRNINSGGSTPTRVVFCKADNTEIFQLTAGASGDVTFTGLISTSHLNLADPTATKMKVTTAASLPVGDDLAVSANSRYLTRNGLPFFSIIDSAWCAPQQLTTAQMDTYVADCVTRKINGIIIELIESTYGDNAPNTIDSIAPFTTPNNFSTPNSTYFARVDYLIDACATAGIVVWMWPMYTGVNGSEGWYTEWEADTTAHRQAWGTFLGNRYGGYKNVVMVHGGDWIVPSFTTLNHYIDAMTTAAPSLLHSYHAARTESAYTAANAQSWLDINNTYINDTNAVAMAATEYARSPTRPLMLVEENYESAGGGGSGIRNVMWQSLCSGCLAGVAYGHGDIWTFGGPGYEANFAGAYGADGRASLQYIRDLIDLYDWWLLAPSTGTSVVTSSLGSGATAICPMISSDTTFAWIYSPSVNFTLNRAAFSPSLIRIRSYTTSTGAFSPITASTANTGTQAITVGADQVIVVDAA